MRSGYDQRTGSYRAGRVARIVSDEEVMVDDSATGLTAVTYGDAVAATITVEDAPVRIRARGTDALPTASAGHLVEPGAIIALESAEEIAAFRAIRTGATSATIHVTYMEYT